MEVCRSKINPLCVVCILWVHNVGSCVSQLFYINSSSGFDMTNNVCDCYSQPVHPLGSKKQKNVVKRTPGFGSTRY